MTCSFQLFIEFFFHIKDINVRDFLQDFSNICDYITKERYGGRDLIKRIPMQLGEIIF